MITSSVISQNMLVMLIDTELETAWPSVFTFGNHLALGCNSLNYSKAARFLSCLLQNIISYITPPIDVVSDHIQLMVSGD